eukprot:g40893.t1
MREELAKVDWEQRLYVEDTNDMLITDDKGAMASEDLEMIMITTEVVLGKLMGLQVDKSPGTDGMHPRVLKEMVGEIANALMGSALGPQLFTIHRDDLEFGIKHSVSKFADDTKMSGRAKDTESLQRDIDRL